MHPSPSLFSRSSQTILFAVWSIMLVRPGLAGEELPTLEQEFLRRAPRVIQAVRERGHKRIGVLKFLIQKEGYHTPPRQDRAGTLNSYAAERLEVALALGNPEEPQQQIDLIHDANQIAARIAGATLRTRAGRDSLFTAEYPLAWGESRVPADAFVSGIIKVDRDLTTLKTVLVLIEKSADSLINLTYFNSSLDRSKLPELDENVFHLRGGFDEGQVVRIREDIQTEFPLRKSDRPIDLSIQYDGQTIPIELEDGQAFVREPDQGQCVVFQLTHRNLDKKRYAAVLKVNGENTLFRQRIRDIECNKWVLDPGDPPQQIEGFQSTEGDSGKFVVLSDEASDALAMSFGPATGTISMTIYQEGNPAPPPRTDEAEDVAAMLNSAFPDTPAKNAQELKYALRSAVAGVTTRGLIFTGNRIANRIERVQFQPDPKEVMHIVVHYRRAK